jgi:hypothetical protein
VGIIHQLQREQQHKQIDRIRLQWQGLRRADDFWHGLGGTQRGRIKAQAAPGGYPVLCKRMNTARANFQSLVSELIRQALV